MPIAQKRLSVIVHHDVLCAWSYLALRRLDPLGPALAGSIEFKYRPFPTRPHDAVMTKAELLRARRAVARAQEEPEGAKLRAELWRGPDAPRSSLPALAALEAARLQGQEAHQVLLRTLLRLAHEDGVNVSRTDVLFEVAGRQGLQMDRFAAAYASPETKRLILEGHGFAAQRGVCKVPTLVIGGRWMLSGLREMEEYRARILSCLTKVGPQGVGPLGGAAH
jgi:predicted DsbA family dithiol-disulfide isomerase